MSGICSLSPYIQYYSFFYIYREELSRILKKADSVAWDPHEYRSLIRKLSSKICASISAYRTEWIEMLRLDDGISECLLDAKKYMSMTTQKLKETFGTLTKLFDPEILLYSGNTKFFGLLNHVRDQIFVRYVGSFVF